jgi:hypothetical protein
MATAPGAAHGARREVFPAICSLVRIGEIGTADPFPDIPRHVQDTIRTGTG